MSYLPPTDHFKCLLSFHLRSLLCSHAPWLWILVPKMSVDERAERRLDTLHRTLNTVMNQNQWQQNSKHNRQFKNSPSFYSRFDSFTFSAWLWICTDPDHLVFRVWSGAGPWAWQFLSKFVISDSCSAPVCRVGWGDTLVTPGPAGIIRVYIFSISWPLIGHNPGWVWPPPPSLTFCWFLPRVPHLAGPLQVSSLLLFRAPGLVIPSEMII